MGQYDWLFFQFPKEETHSGGMLPPVQAYFRGENSVPGSQVTLPYRAYLKPGVIDDEPHYHREEEYLAFVGHDLRDAFDSFDAEIVFYMGEDLDDMEKIVITEPTAVRVPQNWWHGPLKFVRVGKPVLFQAALFSGRPGYIKKVKTSDGELLEFIEGEAHRKPHTGERASVAWSAANEDGVARYTDDGAYDAAKAPDWENCARVPGYIPISYSDATTLLHEKPALSRAVAKSVLAMPKETTDWGSWMPNPKTYFRGQSYMEDATYHVGWQIFTGALNMEEAHFHQGKDEYLFFMGADPMNMFDFDAEIDIMIGDDPDHMETYHINRPPLLFQAAFQDGVWGTITRSLPAEGAQQKQYFSRKYTYDYMGDNVRRCKFNEEKPCIVCGKCFPRQENIE